MTDNSALEIQLRTDLDLKLSPIAISFRAAPPAGVEKFTGSEPSGCSFWRLAAQGRAFYTVPSDHYNCPVGSYTHKIALPADRSQELTNILGTMTSLGYLKMEEVPGIPTLQSTPNVIIYAPLSKTPADPDVVLLSAAPAKLMLLEEAAIRAGAGSKLPLLARPTCVAIPAAMAQGVVTSAGCIGNRVYTDLSDGELYSAIPGSALQPIAEALRTVVSANTALAQYHQERRSQLSTA